MSRFELADECLIEVNDCFRVNEMINGAVAAANTLTLSLRLAFALEVPASSTSFPDAAAISPAVVFPFHAAFSSGTDTKRKKPREGGTPRESSMCFWMRAAFLLFLIGAISEGSANTDMVYAGSKLPLNSIHIPCCSVTITEDTGRWYLMDSW